MASTPSTKELRRATQEVYRAFARYRLAPHAVDCAFCAEDDRHSQVYRKPLRELDRDDLSRFAASPGLGWNGVPDLMHFLPRLFDLLIAGELEVDPEILFAKLTLAGWRAWSKDEQVAIDRWLRAYWTARLADEPLLPSVDLEASLCAIAQAVDDLRAYLDSWRTSRQPSAAVNLAYFVIATNEVRTKRNALRDPYWDNRPSQLRQVVDWLRHPFTREYLEEAFYGETDTGNDYYVSQAVDLLGVRR